MEGSMWMKEFVMKLRVICLLMLLLIAAPIGCGGPREPASPTEDGSQDPQAAEHLLPTEPVKIVNSSTPREAVQAFFTALRDGDEETVTQLLTQKAREESDRNGLAINPPGNHTAVFTVGEVEYIQEDGAHVGGSWTETTAAGTQSIQIVWILRKESAGWRIAGLAARAQDQNVVYNFEDPLEMQQRRAEAEQRERAAEQVDPSVRGAQYSTTPADTTQIR
jgi:hypothetical protein